MADTLTEETSKIPARKTGFFQALVKWGLVANLVLSLITLAVYVLGANFTDESLFLVLWVMRFVSFFVVIFSLYSLVTSVQRMIRKPAATPAMSIVLYFLSFLWGSGLIVFSAFIAAFARGNAY
jgi:hypothetical protein